MAVQYFALDATGNARIRVYWTPVEQPATVSLDGTMLGHIETLAERPAGKDFTLPDSSILHVRFVDDKPQAFRNGFPLTPIEASATNTPATPRKRGGCLMTLLIYNLVSISILMLLNFYFALLGSQEGQTQLAVAGVLFGFLSIAGIVGISAILAWKKWGFYLAVFYVIAGIVLAFPFGIVDFRTFTPLAGLGLLYYLLQRSGAWEHLA